MRLIPKNTNKRILLTGGHAATTGLAVIEEIKKKAPGSEIYWIGSKSAIPGSKTQPIEQTIYPSLGVKYFTISPGKLQTKFTRYTIPLIINIPVSFIQALFLLIKINPAVILALGGYTSLPVAFWGFIFGIPVILHEQTAVAGRASLITGIFAKKIAISRIESSKYFPAGKTVLTGNPMTSDILQVKKADVLHKPPRIFVIGGSRGSVFINELMIAARTELSKKSNVTHVTGERNFEKYNIFQSTTYKLLPLVSPKDMAKFYESSDIIISRAGANSVAEIVAVKRPAILIPLPRTFMDEQYKNALFAESFGLVKVFRESEINPQKLIALIEDIINNWKKVILHNDYTDPDLGASEKLTQIILNSM